MIVDASFFSSPEWETERLLRPSIVVSGGFDPLHGGHVKYITEANLLFPVNTLIVIVNGNGFLERKKGRFVLDENERAFIIDNIAGVDYTVIWDDGSQYVAELLKKIRPEIFAKGGDRNCDANMPVDELNAVKDAGCQLMYGIGGFDKTNSSSDIMRICDAKTQAR